MSRLARPDRTLSWLAGSGQTASLVRELMDSGAPDSIDLELSIARSLQAVAIEEYDLALQEYRAELREWRKATSSSTTTTTDLDNHAADTFERPARPPKPKPPKQTEVIEATKLATAILDVKSKICARDAISRSAVVDLVYRLQAHIRRFVPEEDRQSALLAAISATEIKD